MYSVENDNGLHIVLSASRSANSMAVSAGGRKKRQGSLVRSSGKERKMIFRKMLFIGGLFFSLIGVRNGASAQNVRVLPIVAKSMAYDKKTNLIYAVVGNESNSGFANSVVAIDPTTGKFGKPVFVGTDPQSIVVSDSSQYLYVSVNDGSNVRRLTLSPLASDKLYPVGDGVAIRMMFPLQGKPEGFVAVRSSRGISPDGAVVAVYVNGAAKEDFTHAGHSFCAGIDPSRLFGYENTVSSWDFTSVIVSENGANATISTPSLLSGYRTGLIANFNGLILTTGGGLIDPEARTVIGSFKAKDSTFAVDGEVGQIYSLSGVDEKFAITAWEAKMFSEIGSTSFETPGSKGGARDLMRAGENSLAFRTENSIILFGAARGPKLPTVDLSVKRSAFSAPAANTGEIGYTLTVTNVSSRRSSSAFLTDQLPNGVSFIDVKASQGSANSRDNIVIAELGPIEPQGIATVKVKIKAGNVENPIFVAVVRGDEPDNDTRNNIAIFNPLSSDKVVDLTGEWKSLQQISQGSGANLNATVQGFFTVRNLGKVNSSPTLVRFYLTNFPGLRVEFSQLLQEIQISALRPGGIQELSFSAQLPQGDDATGLFVFASIDPENLNKEKNKGNNNVRNVIR